MRAYRLACFLACVAPALAGTLSVRILDENSRPTPARVYVTDASGKAYFAPGAIVYDKTRGDLSERHFVPPGGAFTLDLPAGPYRIEIERGKEYLPVGERIAVPSVGKVDKTVRLARWVRMTDAGWYSGDMHPHRPLADMATLMEADDLNAAVPITRWRRTTPGIEQDPQLDAFLAKADAGGVYHATDRRWFTVLNEELEPRSAALLVSRLGRAGTVLEYPMADYAAAARRRGALVDSEKATSVELPVVAALGGVQLVGLANNHLWRSGCYAGAWGVWPDALPHPYPATCEGFIRAGFEIYYGLLNMGFPLKLSAGSASGVHPVPLGWSRIYVHVPGNPTPRAWFAALETGRSFATTGPMLLLRVEGHEPGEEFSGAPREVTADLRMLSRQPIAAAEVVVNGHVERVALAPETGRPHGFRGTARLRLDGSAWIAARWVEGRDTAHTSPLYYRVAGKPIPVPREQAAWFAGRVEQLIAGIQDAPGGEAVRERTLARLRQALAVYRSKLAP